jgi:hypothetical protein
MGPLVAVFSQAVGSVRGGPELALVRVAPPEDLLPASAREEVHPCPLWFDPDPLPENRSLGDADRPSEFFCPPREEAFCAPGPTVAFLPFFASDP